MPKIDLVNGNQIVIKYLSYMKTHYLTTFHTLLVVCLLSLPAALLIPAYAQPKPPRQAPSKSSTNKPPAPKPDLLVRRDGTQLEVLVTEITDKEIVYKRFNNLNGPIFRSQKADFSYLRYGSNGELEQFTKVVQSAPAQTAVQATQTPVQTIQTTATPAQTTAQAPTSYVPASVYQSKSVSESKGLRFGFKAGIQSASQSGKYYSLNGFTTKGILGFQAGLILNIPLSPSLELRPQLLYSGKGCTLTNANVSSVKINYLEVPFDVLYKIPTSNGQLMLGGGAYFGYALSGKTGSSEMKIGSGQKDFAITTDFGLRASAWYDMSSGLTLNLFYNLGLANINPTVNVIKYTLKNRTFGLGVGYYLSR